MATVSIAGGKSDQGDSIQSSREKPASLYLWQGYNGDINLTTFDLFSEVNITSVAFGDKHSLLLTSEGDVYVKGANNVSQLGLDCLEDKYVSEPVRLAAFSDPAVVIACGKNHSAVVLDTGQVFCWGDSTNAQCGTGTLDIVTRPTLVPVEIHEGFCQHGVLKPSISVSVKTVACGASHTLALSHEGEVWSWGFGPQLGHGELMHAPVPRRISQLKGRTVVAITCGDTHSLAIALRGEKQNSGSSSPRTKGKKSAENVQEDKHYPSRCVTCGKEIFTYTDTNDMCIIDTLHDCSVNDNVCSIDSTIIEEVSSSSSSNEALRKSGSSQNQVSEKDEMQSNDKNDSGNGDKEGESRVSGETSDDPPQSFHTGDTSQNESVSTEKEESMCQNQDSVLNDSSLLETTALDSSVLVIPAENPFEAEECTHALSVIDEVVSTFSLENSNSVEAGSSVKGHSEPSKIGIDDLQTSHVENQSNEGGVVGPHVGSEGMPKENRSESTDSDGVVWKRRSETEGELYELTVEPWKVKARSISTTSVKSLSLMNQSEAMDYLQRQFEDETECLEKTLLEKQTSDPGPARTVADIKGSLSQDGVTLQDEKEDRCPVDPLCTDDVSQSDSAQPQVQEGNAQTSLTGMLSYPVNMMEQVKSMTSRALTNIQALSGFSEPDDEQEVFTASMQSHDVVPLTSVSGGKSDGKTQVKFSEGMLVSSGSSIGTSEYRDSPDSAPELSAENMVKSGTFIEWTQELSTVEENICSLSRDANQRSLRTIHMQQRNLSRSSVSSTSQPPSVTPVVTATDVWSWGSNSHGQLGTGDSLERSEPVLLKSLTGRHVIKVAAGQAHSLALTANSQVLSWGSNSYGQLGHPEAVVTPTKIKFAKGYSVWDIETGTVHSVFLGDSSNAYPDVFYCGKHPCEDPRSSMIKTSTPTCLPQLKKLGWIVKVMAGGKKCACKMWSPPPPESHAIFELAASERTFYNQLIKTSNLLLRPLQKSIFYSSMDVYPYKSALQLMVTAFGALIKKIGEGVTDLTIAIQNNRPVTQTLILGHHSMFMDVFREYSEMFSNFLAIGGFDFCTRVGSEFFEKIQGSIRDLSLERDKTVGASSLFLRAMRYPFFRLAEYTRIISKMAADMEQEEAKSVLAGVILGWDCIKLNLTSEHKIADNTRLFWEGVSIPKLAYDMRMPNRRMLRESKTHPLMWSGASRFSSHLFVLFNDILLHTQGNELYVYHLETVWTEASTSSPDQQTSLTIIVPEKRFELVATSPAEKAEWLIALNSAISKVLTDQKSIPSLHSSGERFTPPLIRHATSIRFTSPGIYKGAVYNGTWLSGKIHGTGELKWPDGSVYVGKFKQGLMHGSGTLTLVRPGGREVQKGSWKDGKLNGLATVSYANRDLYKGYFRDGQRFGHGMYQSGRHKSSCAAVYIGEWLANVREGYGIHDDILRGEKYMGMWVDDCRHGNGIMVTLDGMYFEGNFVQNKLTGFGVMVSDDNTLYEGDFMGTTHLSGKGTLMLPTGDRLEGSFSGSLNESLKVNGTFVKATTGQEDSRKYQHSAGVQSKYFGRLCVSADAKWADIFSHTTATLGQTLSVKFQGQMDTEKAWEAVAVLVSAGRKTLKEDQRISPSKMKFQQNILEGLEKIPVHYKSSLDTDTLSELVAYLVKAFDSSFHPLGQLMGNVVDVFRATYIGVGAHPRLLHHAIQEVRSFVRRIYQVVRILFPNLPAKGGPVHIHPPSKQDGPLPLAKDAEEFVEGLEVEDPNVHILTAAGILYPILLPKIYPPLFDLYALYNEKNDDRYWERVTKLNRQSDMGLMAYLGIEQRFWLMEGFLQDSSQRLSTIKDECYVEAVDSLQQLSTAFSPIEKLKVIEQTFNLITKTVALALKDDLLWCMDDLFPIFQYVVVRAKINHLGAEIHMVEDLLEPHLELGEFGLMFTTLKACYFQIQNEKMPHH